MIIIQNNTDSDNWIPGIGLMWPYERREITIEHARTLNGFVLMGHGVNVCQVQDQSIPQEQADRESTLSATT